MGGEGGSAAFTDAAGALKFPLGGDHLLDEAGLDTVGQHGFVAGVAFVDENDQKYRGYVPPAYRWLQTHFARFVPGYAGGLLWWAYCRKPDLRCHRHVLQKGTWVRLELEMPEASLLRFPCWAFLPAA